MTSVTVVDWLTQARSEYEINKSMFIAKKINANGRWTKAMTLPL